MDKHQRSVPECARGGSRGTLPAPIKVGRRTGARTSRRYHASLHAPYSAAPFLALRHRRVPCSTLPTLRELLGRTTGRCARARRVVGARRDAAGHVQGQRLCALRRRLLGAAGKAMLTVDATMQCALLQHCSAQLDRSIDRSSKRIARICQIAFQSNAAQPIRPEPCTRHCGTPNRLSSLHRCRSGFVSARSSGGGALPRPGWTGSGRPRTTRADTTLRRL